MRVFPGLWESTGKGSEMELSGKRDYLKEITDGFDCILRNHSASTV